MNAYAKRYAEGFRTERLNANPRGTGGGEWLEGMARHRRRAATLKRLHPSVRLELTEYGWCRSQAMRGTLHGLVMMEGCLRIAGKVIR